MPKITFIDFAGTAHDVQASEGSSLMETALDHGVPGIDGDCGGEAACGTCHLFVESPWAEKLPGIEPAEDTMLNIIDDRESTSRLSCQLRVSAALDGLTVRLPESQH